jgi:hypothetical protein
MMDLETRASLMHRRETKKQGDVPSLFPVQGAVGGKREYSGILQKISSFPVPGWIEDKTIKTQ